MSPTHTPHRAVVELLEDPLRALATTFRQAAIALLDDDGGIHAGMAPARLDLHVRRIGEVEDVEDALRRLLSALDAIAELNRRIDALPPDDDAPMRPTSPRSHGTPDVDLPF
jgi:hypothetical protein